MRSDHWWDLYGRDNFTFTYEQDTIPIVIISEATEFNITVA